MNKLFFAFVLLIFNATYCNGSWAVNSITVQPLNNTTLPTSILKEQSTTAYYLVTNNTSEILSANYVKFLPPNVTQILDNPLHFDNFCSKYFELKPANSKDNKHTCILQLAITGAINQNDPDPKHHLTICHGETDCYSVDKKENELNVTVGKPNPLALTAIVREAGGSISYTSTDGGVSWTAHNIPTPQSTVRSATCSGKDGQYCTAVGDYRSDNHYATTFMSYTSTNGGNTWIPHIMAKHSGLSLLTYVNCNGSFGENCTALGEFDDTGHLSQPIIYTSIDGGANWTPHTLGKFSENKPYLRAVNCSGNHGNFCTAVGDYHIGYENKRNLIGFIAYKSTDGGNTWSSHEITSYFDQSHMTDLKCSGENGQSCIAVGYLNKFDGKHDLSSYTAATFITNDGGEHWTQQTNEQDNGNIFKAITCNRSDPTRCVAVGAGQAGSSFISSDDGKNWKPTSTFNTLTTVTCNGENSQYCAALGYYSEHNKVLPIIFYSNDGGNSWVTRRRLGFEGFNNHDNPHPNEVAEYSLNITGCGS